MLHGSVRALAGIVGIESVEIGMTFMQCPLLQTVVPARIHVRAQVLVGTQIFVLQLVLDEEEMLLSPCLTHLSKKGVNSFSVGASNTKGTQFALKSL